MKSRRVLVVGAVTVVAAGAAAALSLRRRQATEGDPLALGWGDDGTSPQSSTVERPDGARLALWDVPGPEPDAPVVVLPHCWGCSHEIWVPVARRLREQGYRVVLYDQRGHGASSRGTAPLDVGTLADDLAAVLDATDVDDAVLAGHSMGGMTVMALAAFRPDALCARARAVVLVATAATAGAGTARATQLARYIVGSPLLGRAMRARYGHMLVRGVFGTEAVRAQMQLTSRLFGGCDGAVRGDFMLSLAALDLLEGIASINVPTTVVVGNRDRLTVPAKSDEMVATIPGARLVTLPDRGHMLPLEDPDAVTDEIVRAAKG